MDFTVVPQHDALPTPLDQAKRIIAAAKEDHDLVTLLEMRNSGAAYEHYFQRRNDSKIAANDAGEIKVTAERAIGDLDRTANPHGGRNDQVGGTPNLVLGVEDHTRAAWRKLAALDEEEFYELIALARADEDAGISTAYLLRLLDDPNQRLKASNNNEWYTPASYIEAAREVLGGIDLDPASTEIANRTVRATDIYSQGDKSLDRKWAGRTWLNPPYGGLSGEFAGKLVDSYEGGDVPEAILLVNANSTDAGWFQPLWEYTLCFTDHRINFVPGPGTKASGSTHGSVFIYLGPEPAKFARHFRQFGNVVRRYDE